MKYIYLLTGGLCCLFLFSCNPSSPVPQAQKSYDLEKLYNTSCTITLEETGARMEYIALQTDSLCLMASAFQVAVTPEYIFVLSLTPEIFQFTRDGKFIRRIAAAGNGPGEYTWIYWIWVQEESGRIYLYDLMNIHEYDFRGRFIADHPKTVEMGKLLVDHENKIFLSKLIFRGNEKDKLVVKNPEGDTLARFDNHVKFKYNPDKFLVYMIYKDLFLTEGNVIFHQYLNDTVYTYNPQTRELEYRYSFLNSKPLTRKVYENMKENLPQAYCVADVSEDTAYIYVMILHKGKRKLFVIKKDTGEFFRADFRYAAGFDSGFYPRWQSGGMLVDAFKPGSLNYDDPGKITPAGREAAMEFFRGKTGENITEESNPVIVIYSLPEENI